MKTENGKPTFGLPFFLCALLRSYWFVFTTSERSGQTERRQGDLLFSSEGRVETPGQSPRGFTCGSCLRVGCDQGTRNLFVLPCGGDQSDFRYSTRSARWASVNPRLSCFE